VFSAFHKEHPGVDVVLRSYDFSGLVRSLQRKTIDLAFMLHEGLNEKTDVNTFHDEAFNRKLITKDEMVFLLPYVEGEDYSSGNLRNLLKLYQNAYISRHHALFNTAGKYSGRWRCTRSSISATAGSRFSCGL
jgi:DNA-binding transcriptional LysR family regulator